MERSLPATSPAGQTCVQGARVLVSDKLYDRFAAAFVEKVSKLRVGPPLDNRTDVGPLVAQRQRDRVLSYIETGIREGATLAFGKAGGTESGDGMSAPQYSPTLRTK